jgi:hypothetical protein
VAPFPHQACLSQNLTVEQQPVGQRLHRSSILDGRRRMKMFQLRQPAAMLPKIAAALRYAAARLRRHQDQLLPAMIDAISPPAMAARIMLPLSSWT